MQMNTLSDEAIITELGLRLARRRVELELTQATVAKQTGVSKRTIERLEAGATIQLSTLIRILRFLQLLDGLEALVPEAKPRPLELLKLKGKSRQRASRKKVQIQHEAWQWGDKS